MRLQSDQSQRLSVWNNVQDTPLEPNLLTLLNNYLLTLLKISRVNGSHLLPSKHINIPQK